MTAKVKAEVRRLAVCLVALLVLVMSCGGSTTSTHPVSGGPAVAHPPVTDNPAAAEHFERATGLYHAGRFDESIVELRLFGAEYPDDVLSPRAELYLGRALAASGNLDDAMRLFQALAEVGSDPGVARASVWYVAFCHAARGDLDAAMAHIGAFLARNAGASVVSGEVIRGDEALLGSLVAEVRIAGGDPEGALIDLAQVHHAVGGGDLASYALPRALQVAGALPVAAACGQQRSASSFVVGVVTGRCVRGRLSDGDAQGAAEALALGGPAMDGLGLTGRLEELGDSVARASERGAAMRWGAVLGLSGPNRRAGRAVLGSLLLAQRAFDPVESPSSVLLIRDVGGEAARVEAAIEALDALGVAAIVGPVEADLARVARRACEARGIPFVSLSPERSEGALAWRVSLDAEVEAQEVVSRAIEAHGLSRFVVVRERSATAQEGEDPGHLGRFADAARRAVEDAGATVIREVALDTDPAGLQAAAASAARTIAATDADAVVFALRGEAIAAVSANLANEGVWALGRTPPGKRRVAYLLHSFAADAALLRNAADYVQGAWIPIWYATGLRDGVAREFGDRFRYAFGRDAGPLEAAAWDAGTLVRSAVLASGGHRATLASVLAARPATEGALGTVSFDATGNLATRPVLGTIAGGRLVLRP